ncbi:MAG: DUF3597 domain-containing protein [Chthoniobacterales bacterium]
MSLFNNLMSKIFGHGSSTATTAASSAPGASGTTGATQSQPTTQQGQPPSSQTTAAPGGGTTTQQPVDVAAVLDSMAAKNSEKLDWKHSIVDLMKLVGMDSSLSSRKQLATELHYTGDQNDSASMNIWLHKEVLKKLAANGGKVPPELLK